MIGKIRQIPATNAKIAKNEKAGGTYLISSSGF
jgi:hypothetical protein